MDFNPSTVKVFDLLHSQNLIRIPDFQRNFSWEKKENTTLLTDMLNNLVISKNKIAKAEYYLGTMIFIEGKEKNGSRTVLECIDGQQRLTSITILLSALGDIYNTIKAESQKERIFDYIVPKDNDGHLVKILDIDSSYPYFYDFIQSRDKDTDISTNSYQETLIQKTYSEFKRLLGKKQLERMLEIGENDIDYMKILNALRDQILGATIIKITTADASNANKIFESINSRGRPLSGIELIKSYILGNISDAEKHKRANTAWRTTFKKFEFKNQPVQDAVFFRHYWSSKFKNVTLPALYTSFIKAYKERPVDELLLFLKDLEAEASLYKVIVQPDLKNDFKNKKEFTWFIQSMDALNNTFDITLHRIPLLALLDIYWSESIPNKLSSKNLKKIVKFLESFHFMFTSLLSSRASKVEPIYSRFSIALRAAKSQTEVMDIVKSKLYDPLRQLIPEETEFVELFTNRMKYTNINSSQVPLSNMLTKYVMYNLWCYENGEEIYPQNASIEHILPESEKVESYKTIGNLLVIESKYNHEAETKPFQQKVEIYQKSKYENVKNFCVNYSNFSSESIEGRSKDIAKTYYKMLMSLLDL